MFRRKEKILPLLKRKRGLGTIYHSRGHRGRNKKNYHPHQGGEDLPSRWRRNIPYRSSPIKNQREELFIFCDRLREGSRGERGGKSSTKEEKRRALRAATSGEKTRCTPVLTRQKNEKTTAATRASTGKRKIVEGRGGRIRPSGKKGENRRKLPLLLRGGKEKET